MVAADGRIVGRRKDDGSLVGAGGGGGAVGQVLADATSLRAEDGTVLDGVAHAALGSLGRNHGRPQRPPPRVKPRPGPPGASDRVGAYWRGLGMPVRDVGALLSTQVLDHAGVALGRMRPDGLVVARDGRVVGKRHPHGALVAPGPSDVLATNTSVRPLSTSGRLSGRLSPPRSATLPELVDAVARPLDALSA